MAIPITEGDELFACEVCKAVYYGEHSAKGCEASHEKS